MREKTHKRLTAALLMMIMLSAVLPVQAFAAEDSSTRYELGEDSLVNTGKDNGYSEENELDKDDPHWDWQLGEFYVSGYTRQTEDDDGNPLFLKNVGDTVTLWFSLQQDIDCLNGNEKLTISEDEDGWDKHLGVTQQNFGRGMLIVKFTDYQNNTTVNTYQNFLAANATTTADTKVEMFEEGDYEIALDYEIRKAPLDIFGWEPFPSYTNYRITFKFSVRNGNCMVFPFDVKTGAELTNEAVTENGFYLDLAKSRYLDIDIKKENLKDGAEGLVEDIRFNKPAKDGNEYTDEGIYTITVSNRYTGRETTKVIYVGTNEILKAYAVTGLSIQEIETQLAAGATIAEDGTIIPPETKPEEPVETEPSEPGKNNPVDDEYDKELEEQEETNPVVEPIVTLPDTKPAISPIVAGSVILVAMIATIYAIIKRKKETKTEYKPGEEDEQ